MRMVAEAVPASARSTGSSRADGLSALSRSSALSAIFVTSPHSAEDSVTLAGAEVLEVHEGVNTNAVAKAD